MSLLGTGRKRMGFLRGNLGVIILTSALWVPPESMALSFFSLYVLELGGSYFSIGLISAITGVCGIIPIVLGGYLADTVGRKKMIYLMSYFLGFSYLLTSLAPGWELLLVTQAVRAFCLGLRGPAFTAMIADSTKPESRAIGFALWSRIPQIAAMFSPLVAGWFIEMYGVVPAVRWFFIATFVMAMIVSTMRYRFLTETLSESSSIGNTSVVRELKDFFGIFKRTDGIISQQVLIILVLSMARTLSSSITEPYWIIHGTKVIGLTPLEWGLISLIAHAVLNVVSLAFALISDRYGRLKAILPPLFLAPIAAILFPYCRNFSQALLLLIAKNIASEEYSAPLSALISDYTPRRYRGRVNATSSMLSEASTTLGSLMGGYTYQNYSKTFTFLLGGAIAGLTVVLFIAKVKEPVKREE